MTGRGIAVIGFLAITSLQCSTASVPASVPAGAVASCPVLPGTRLLTFQPRLQKDSFLHVDISIGGGSIRQRMTIDTGSTGIAIPKQIAGPDTRPLTAAEMTLIGSPTIFYNSSGRELQGDWVWAPVTIHGANGVTATTAPIPVLEVTRVVCRPGYPHCRPEEGFQGGMMGVGFSREPTGNPIQNPFLNVREMVQSPPTMQQGYVFTATGVTLGIRPAALPRFTLIPLTRSSPTADWDPPAGCLEMSGGGIDQPLGPVCGQILMDTGIDYGIVSYPPALRPTFRGAQADPLPPGTSIRISWTSGPGPAFTFPFTIVPPRSWRWEQPVPAFVRWGLRDEGLFVNTSRQLLQTADYLYDADCGRIGFRPH